jgi:type II secretory pathway pseudopilin PulG
MKGLFKKVYSLINDKFKILISFNETKNESGYTLIIVFLVLTILMVLGTAYVSVALSEIKQAERHEKRVQAYYYARSGAEKAYTRIKEGLKDEFNAENDYFDNFTWDLENPVILEDNNPPENKINVTIYENYDTDNPDQNKLLNITDYSSLQELAQSQEKIFIKSIGRVKYQENDIEETVILDLKLPDSYTPPSADSNDENTETAQENEWVKGNGNNSNSNGSGVIEPIQGESDKAIVFQGSGNSLKLNQGVAQFKAEKFYFEDEKDKSIQIKPDSILKLYSDTNIFYIGIELDTHNNKDDGGLCLRTSDENIDQPGLVYFGKGLTSGDNVIESGVYYFPNKGICLPDDIDELVPYTGNYSDLEEWTETWK